MYKQPGQEEFLFYILYTGAAVLSLISCCYLLFRRGNAFAPDIKSSARLRRWTAALFASTTLSHAWYLPGVFLTSDDDIMLHDLVGGLLDSITVIPLSIVVMFCMLQDRKRPLWPATPSSAGCTIRRQVLLHAAGGVYDQGCGENLWLFFYLNGIEQMRQIR